MNLSISGERREPLNWAVSLVEANFPLQRFKAGARVCNRAALDQRAARGGVGVGVGEPKVGAGPSVFDEGQVMHAAGLAREAA